VDLARQSRIRPPQLPRQSQRLALVRHHASQSSASCSSNNLVFRRLCCATSARAPPGAAPLSCASGSAMPPRPSTSRQVRTDDASRSRGSAGASGAGNEHQRRAPSRCPHLRRRPAPLCRPDLQVLTDEAQQITVALLYCQLEFDQESFHFLQETFRVETLRFVRECKCTLVPVPRSWGTLKSSLFAGDRFFVLSSLTKN